MFDKAFDTIWPLARSKRWWWLAKPALSAWLGLIVTLIVYVPLKGLFWLSIPLMGVDLYNPTFWHWYVGFFVFILVYGPPVAMPKELRD